ncbi:MAG: hypothetical protein JWQ81_6146 [Amycolatopsis sp.]|uniref:hypothetical protein n=1 Tax=Amycolatopsis sp. TaxID=37632 RepID=UPI002605059B|nr:hypothetical protein [Amycolatopsis sp.]MCU1685407.1 hypothetical protein [Amycolatopsis sp.]
MNGWAVCAVVVIGGPLLLLVHWAVSDWLRQRRQRRLIVHQQPDWSVSAIVARVEQERADEATAWPTGDPEVTEVLPMLPVDEQPYVGRKPSPYPRQRMPLQPPDTEVIRQVLDGLKRLD